MLRLGMPYTLILGGFVDKGKPVGGAWSSATGLCGFPREDAPSQKDTRFDVYQPRADNVVGGTL